MSDANIHFYGRKQAGPLSAAIGARVFDAAPGGHPEPASRAFAGRSWRSWASPAELAGVLDDSSFGAGLRRETDEALARTGRDVGTCTASNSSQGA